MCVEEKIYIYMLQISCIQTKHPRNNEILITLIRANSVFTLIHLQNVHGATAADNWHFTIIILEALGRSKIRRVKTTIALVR